MAPKLKKTVSWRTLVRRAKKATANGHTGAAKRLHAQATELRRASRKPTKKALAPKASRSEIMRKSWAKRKQATETKPDLDLIVSRAPNKIFADRDADRLHSDGIHPSIPGHGELVGGSDALAADQIAKLARKRGGVDAIQAELAKMLAAARTEGQKMAAERYMKATKETHERTIDNVVCSAIAVFEAQMRKFDGLPATVTTSGYTICRMIDALNRAGYTANGKI